MLEREAIAARLRDIARALELLGESRFRVAAYRKGADALLAVHGDLDALIAAGRLTQVPGIGETLAAQIAELRATGAASLLDTLAKKLPKGALDAPVRGSKKARASSASDMLRFAEAREIASSIREHMLASDGVQSVDAAGDLRRGKELLPEVTLLATAKRPREAIARFEELPSLSTVDAKTSRAIEGRLIDGARVRLEVATPRDRALALARATGPEAHARAVEEIAKRRGVRAAASEEELYDALGLAFVPPELRDEDDAVARAKRHALPKLVTLADVRGMVHCHTTYSDGRHSIEQMARAAEARGMKYITITDHSPTAFYANGLKLDRLKRQWDEIARVQEKVTIRILRGTESDITKDGALDYPDAVLAKLDVIVASIHNRYKQDRRAMTARIIRALRHPLFKIWGHALGRLLLRRPPVDVDIDAVLEAASESRVAIELNGDPWRMDMEPALAARARELGLPFVISVDAHATGELANVETGVTMARRAGLTRADVLNAREADDFVRAVKPAGDRTRTKSVGRAARASRR